MLFYRHIVKFKCRLVTAHLSTLARLFPLSLQMKSRQTARSSAIISCSRRIINLCIEWNKFRYFWKAQNIEFSQKTINVINSDYCSPKFVVCFPNRKIVKLRFVFSPDQPWLTKPLFANIRPIPPPSSFRHTISQK